MKKAGQWSAWPPLCGESSVDSGGNSVLCTYNYALVYSPTNLYSVFSLLDVWNKRDYYKILGLSPNADQKDVKKAYFQACHLTDTHVQCISYMVTQTVYIKTFEGEVLVSCCESKVNL